MKSFIIVSAPRSGSTSLCRILNSASDLNVASEPSPGLHEICRACWDGDSAEKYEEVLRDTIIKRLNVTQSGIVYGEKNVTYGPFIPLLSKLVDCVFVYLYRDGREVVTSLMNWHNNQFGTIYREAGIEDGVTDVAIKNSFGLEIQNDLSDFARPRPSNDEMTWEEWASLSRFEMCCYYWGHCNAELLDNCRQIDDSRYYQIDYSTVSSKEVSKVFDFLGSAGIPSDLTEELLDKKINSLGDRGFSEEQLFSNWMNWSSNKRRQFEKWCGSTMKSLNYWSDSAVNWRPSKYGEVWIKQFGADVSWFEWMYQGRELAHKDLKAFYYERKRGGDQISSVCDVGCGLSVGYHDFFKDLRYTGVDLVEENIKWCQKNRDNPNHSYLCRDVISEELNEKYDLVFSQGTIDNCYDVNGFIEALVMSSNKWVYITACRGWFPSLKNHSYNWNSKDGCFYNDVSPTEIETTLKSLGCKNIQIDPLKVRSDGTGYETRIIASVC